MANHGKTEAKNRKIASDDEVYHLLVAVLGAVKCFLLMAFLCVCLIVDKV
jgi:hypothetical protein